MYGTQKYNSMIGRLEYELRGKPNLFQPISQKRRKLKVFLKKITPEPIWNLMKKIYHMLGGKK